MNPYALFGVLRARAGQGQNLKAILQRGMLRMHEVQGCQAYLVHADPDDADAVWVYEVWDSPDEHQASLQVDFVQALIGEAMPILDGMPTGGQALELLGGHGLK